MISLSRFARKVLIFSVVLAILTVASAIVGMFSHPHAESVKRFRPLCDGLPCRNKWECGTKCTCEFRAGSPTGICVVK